jgi:SAM-dependent methyltransferase
MNRNGEAVLSAAAWDTAAFARDDALLGIRRHPRFSMEYRNAVEQRWPLRQAAEAALAAIALDRGELRGYCTCCHIPTQFAVPLAPVAEGGPPLPEWSETLLCASCGLISRLRLGASELMRYVDPNRSAVYLTEQTTPLFAWLSWRLTNLSGSEFVDNPAERTLVQEYLDSVHGAGRCRLRHEDVTQLSFADQSLDALMSLEVLEHVPDFRKALREYARVLRTHGVAILSVPFGELSEHTIVRATMGADGTVTHLLEPEYHGDPATGGHGCLCYYHFGWDLLDEIRTAGFASVDFLDAWEPAYGFLGGMAVFVARR